MAGGRGVGSTEFKAKGQDMFDRVGSRLLASVAITKRGEASIGCKYYNTV
jgi:hypothetical protein